MADFNRQWDILYCSFILCHPRSRVETDVGVKENAAPLWLFRRATRSWALGLLSNGFVGAILLLQSLLRWLWKKDFVLELLVWFVVSQIKLTIQFVASQIKLTIQDYLLLLSLSKTWGFSSQFSYIIQGVNGHTTRALLVKLVSLIECQQ